MISSKHSFNRNKKLKYIYSRCILDCNQLNLQKSFQSSTFDGLSVIMNTIKLFAKKRNTSLDSMVTMKIKIECIN